MLLSKYSTFTIINIVGPQSEFLTRNISHYRKKKKKCLNSCVCVWQVPFQWPYPRPGFDSPVPFGCFLHETLLQGPAQTVSIHGYTHTHIKMHTHTHTHSNMPEHSNTDAQKKTYTIQYNNIQILRLGDEFRVWLRFWLKIKNWTITVPFVPSVYIHYICIYCSGAVKLLFSWESGLFLLSIDSVNC